MAGGYERFGAGDHLGGNMRVGDAERETVAAQLRDHFADGRLTQDELNERLDLAFAARTRADLDRITRDLPRTGDPVSVPPDGQRGDRSDRARSAGTDGSGRLRAGALALVPALVMVWVFLILGGALAFGFGRDRPLGIIFLIAAFALLRRMFGRRRRYGRRYGCCGRRW